MSLVLTDIAVQRQVLLERFKAAEVRKYTATLRKVDAEIRRQLSGNRLTDFRRARLETQLSGIKQAIKGQYKEYTELLNKDLRSLAVDAARFEANTFAVYAPTGVSIATPAPNQLWSAVQANPLTMTGANGGAILETFMESWADGDAELVTNAVRMGYTLGETNDQILARIRGNAALNYSDGVLAKNRAHAETVTRTAIQHVANSARAETWAANSDIIDEYQWVSTLDSRTTPLCRDRDGKTFPVGKGPLPPAHPNCRSTTVAVIKGDFGKFLDEESERASVNGPVPAGETYYDWLKRQDSAFQDLALGPTRGKLFRDGGLSTDDFSKLNLGRNFEPLSLAEMRSIQPEAFQRAGIPLPGAPAAVAASPVEAALQTLREAQGYTITGNPIPASYGPGMNVKNPIPYDEGIADRLNKFGSEERGRITDAIQAHRNGEQLLPIQNLVPSSLKTFQPTVTREGLEYRLQNPGFVATNKFDTPQIIAFRLDGQYYVWDGNHRASAALMKGEDFVQALVIDLDP